MSCIKLYTGQDNACKVVYKKYYQQVVLVNKDDVESHVISTASVLGGVFSVGSIPHRIRFSLKEDKTGYLFRGPENGNNYFATFQKETDDNIPQYIHNVQLPIIGAEESTKALLRTLDLAKYFAAIQYMDGTVEIYGFENGLSTDDYEFDLANGGGGSFINLISLDNGLEDDPPYIYVPITGTANEDFNNLFADIVDVDLGDFNDDFNDDFDIT